MSALTGQPQVRHCTLCAARPTLLGLGAVYRHLNQEHPSYGGAPVTFDEGAALDGFPFGASGDAA